MIEFKSFLTLFSMTDPNVKTWKKTERRIKNEAVEWIEQFGGTYGTHGIAGAKPGLYFYYTPPDILVFEVPGGLKGGMYFRFIIQAYHFAHWETPAFVLGYDEQKIGSKRDDNPFSEQDFYNRAAWDMGFVLSVYGYTIESFLGLFKPREK